jgi:hypothetical protein
MRYISSELEFETEIFVSLMTVLLWVFVFLAECLVNSALLAVPEFLHFVRYGDI